MGGRDLIGGDQGGRLRGRDLIGGDHHGQLGTRDLIRGCGQGRQLATRGWTRGGGQFEHLIRSEFKVNIGEAESSSEVKVNMEGAEVKEDTGEAG